MDGDSKFGFFFEKNGLHAFQGQTLSAEEHFKEFKIEEALAREMGQNSLDARAPHQTGPVRMEFELAQVEVSELPDFETLKRHIVAADTSTSEIDASNTRLRDAAEATRVLEMPVLRIGDYGTTGLTGSESRESHQTPLSALTRSRGVSSGKSGKGGSFGLGASTGALASAISTVLWTSRPINSDKTVFAGQSQLSTHRLDEVLYGPDGFFTDRTLKEDFLYLRSPEPIKPFPPRLETGTDTYILSYCNATVDPLLHQIRDAFIRNFFVAIDRRMLEVHGRAGGEEWVLDSETLPKLVQDLPDVLPFYKAIKSEPHTANSALLGELELYMEFDESLPKKLNTITMRKPLMKVDTYRHDSIRAKYAAVMVCESEPGNSILRKLEPPAHDKWTGIRQAEGQKAVDAVKRFIKEGLKTRVVEQLGDEVTIKGMNRLLPAGLGNDALADADFGNAGDSQRGNEEATSVHGNEAQSEPRIAKRAAVPAGTRAAGVQGEGDPALAGKNRSGTGKIRTRGGDNDVDGNPGDGTAKVLESEVTMRSWSDLKSGDLIVILKSESGTRGDITLRAIKGDGSPEKNYTLPITRVEQIGPGEPRVLNFSKNEISDIIFPEVNPVAKLRVSLSNSRRFRLGVI